MRTSENLERGSRRSAFRARTNGLLPADARSLAGVAAALSGEARGNGELREVAEQLAGRRPAGLPLCYYRGDRLRIRRNGRGCRIGSMQNSEEVSGVSESKRGDAGAAGEESRGPVAAVVGFCREHPYLAAVVVAFTVLGAVCGAVLPFGESLSLTRRVLGGALVGAFFSLFPMGAHLYE